MACFRRTLLTLIMVALTTNAAAARQNHLAVVILEIHGSGRLVIANTQTIPQAIARKIEIQVRHEAVWSTLPDQFQAISNCQMLEAGGPVILAPRKLFAVVPWTGLLCSGQCPEGCRANGYNGRGPFRFVVTLLPRNERVLSPVFTMPHIPVL